MSSSLNIAMISGGIVAGDVTFRSSALKCVCTIAGCGDLLVCAPAGAASAKAAITTDVMLSWRCMDCEAFYSPDRIPGESPAMFEQGGQWPQVRKIPKFTFASREQWQTRRDFTLADQAEVGDFSGYSGFTVAVSRSHNAKWLFHQGKATLNRGQKRLQVLCNRSNMVDSSRAIHVEQPQTPTRLGGMHRRESGARCPFLFRARVHTRGRTPHRVPLHRFQEL